MFVETQLKQDQKRIVFCGQHFILDALGCMFHIESKTLVFSDLHLEKGSYLISQGNPLPMIDTLDTILKIQKCIDVYKPETVIALGDSLHDVHALERMHPDDKAFIMKICQSVQHWHWIMGNHDKNPEKQDLFTQFNFSSKIVTEQFQYVHDVENTDLPQIIGHFHPKASINIGPQTIRGKCFLITEKLIVMPAFGTFTGGLDIHSEAIEKLLNGQTYQCYLLKRSKVWQIK